MSTLTSMALLSLTCNPCISPKEKTSSSVHLGVINDGSETQDFLEFSTEAVTSKNAKFAVEYAFADYVHIRSSLTNKYWMRSSKDGNWIVAKGVRPVVDTNSWTCTLFRMDFTDNKTGTFYHVQSSRTVCVPEAGSDREYCLTIDPAAVTTARCYAVDYDTIVILPKFVAFKGSNGLFYKNYSEEGDDTYAHFCVSEIADPNIKCEIEYTSNGNIRVKASNNPKMCWSYFGSLQDDLIGWDQSSDDDDPNQMFTPIRINKNTIVLRCLGNNKICKRADVKDSLCKTDRLVATGNGLEKDSYLEVFETVFSRTVKTYEYDLEKAIIYGVELLCSSEHVWDNYTEVAESGAANCIIRTKKITSHNNNCNISGTVSTSIETGIPHIAEGKISVSATAGYSREWGSSEEVEQEIGDSFTVVVQPMKRTIAKGVATKGTCDVPFSYVQKDYPLSGGPPIITKLSDGVFTTTNAYSFKDEVRYEDLPPHDGPPDEAPTLVPTHLPALCFINNCLVPVNYIFVHVSFILTLQNK